jgi:hypothetical protein
MVGFEAAPDEVLASLGVITGDENITALQEQFYIESINRTRSSYIMEESELEKINKNLYEILHGRAYIIDVFEINETTSSQPHTFYVAADKGKGLIIPGRSLFIEALNGEIYYRWTDTGDYWTEWITLMTNKWHTYDTIEKCRFAEIQVYAKIKNTKINIRVTR